LFFQSLLGLGVSGIQRHIVGSVFIQRLQTFFINVMFLHFQRFILF